MSLIGGAVIIALLVGAVTWMVNTDSVYCPHCRRYHYYRRHQ